jgi:hypothetical protein
MAMMFDAGFAADQCSHPGTAALTASLLTDGTKTRDALCMSDDLQRLGAQWQGGSILDASTVFLSALKPKLDDSRALFAEVILHPRFSKHGFRAREPGNPFEGIVGNRVPLVLLDRGVPGLQAAFVGVNDEEVGLLATRHLLERGCKRIAHPASLDISTGRGRFEGYRKALESAGLGGGPDFVIRIPSADSRSAENGFEADAAASRPRSAPRRNFLFQ